MFFPSNPVLWVYISLAKCYRNVLVQIVKVFAISFRSLAEWQSMVGDDSERPLQITYERESGLDVSGPKHGKVCLISVCLHQALSHQIRWGGQVKA